MRIRHAQGFVAEVVLVDPRQPVAGQRRHVVAHERPEADIAGFGDQHGAQARHQVFGARGAFADMSKGFRESGAAGDFQYDFRQIDYGHARGHFLAQRLERRRLLDLVELGEDQLMFVTL